MISSEIFGGTSLYPEHSSHYFISLFTFNPIPAEVTIFLLKIHAIAIVTNGIILIAFIDPSI
jgi:hypothetical protein